MNRRQALDRARPLLDWLRHSIDAHQGRGSAAWHHPLRGWAPPYPETTGYLIPTLLDWATLSGENDLADRARHCADWLLDIQLPEGAFPGGIGSRGEPLVFDTGQILFGLEAMSQRPHGERYRAALYRAARWLADALDADGIWHGHQFVPGYSPAWQLRTVWALAHAARSLGDASLEAAAHRAWQAYRDCLDPQLPWGVRRASLQPGTPADLHFHVYVLEGAAACAELFQDATFLHRTAEMTVRLADFHQRTGRLPGRLSEDSGVDLRHRCPVGEAQFALVQARLARRGMEGCSLAHAEAILQAVPVCRLPIPGWRGGIPGSRPWWGPYQRFRHINWAPKFWLDACRELMEEE